VKRTSTSLIALGVASVLAVACAQPAAYDVTLTAGGTGDGPTAPQTSDDPSAVAQRAVDDVTEFWRDTYADVYGDQWVDLAGFYPYGPDTEMPPCGPYQITYEEIADNAFYCPDDDIIAWDEGQLMPQLNQEFGAFTVAIVIAHEYGHAVQDRVGVPDRTVDLELQADCFAGAWTQRVADGEAQGFEQDDIDLDKTVAGMLSIRDVPGSDPNDPMAHGSGFDRVAAFQDGYENGPEQCASYADPDVDRPTVELEFDRTEASTGGDLPLEDDWDGQGSQGLLSLVEQDLNAYYAQLFDELGEQFTPVDDLVIVDSTASVSCGDDQLSADEIDYAAFYCVDDNTIVLGAELIELLHQDIGDFAVASEIALLWAAAAQEQLGVEPGSEAALQADCLTGSWGSWTYPDGTPPSSEVLRISGGDLDEGIMAFLAYASEDSDTTVFDRSEALRTGFFDGYDACEEYGPLG
jgi:predicted metalloprotease